jgi:hypothetical protein
MADVSVLSERGSGGTEDRPAREPECFRDLNLDAFVDAVLAGMDEYDLRAFYCSPLSGLAEIEYRQEVAKELEEGPALAIVKAFGLGMRAARERKAQAAGLRHEHQRARWFLDAAQAYCDAVLALAEKLRRLGPRSRGLADFSACLGRYVETPRFRSLHSDLLAVLRAMEGVRYALIVRRGELRVARSAGEAGYEEKVEELFARFEGNGGKDYASHFSDPRDLNQVEAGILDLVARLFPAEFAALGAFRSRHADYAEPFVLAFDREIQFYVSYLDHIAGLKRLGLGFCYPVLSAESKETVSRGSFDIVLAAARAAEGESVVANDFRLSGSERILVITGPNQGGKSTFARSFGQLHYLARLGLSVPGSEARLLLCDTIFTHFEREEGREDRRGRLKDELERMRSILEAATPRSVLVLNESFASTSLKDAVHIGRRVLERIAELDALCVFVTFMDELAEGEKRVSMMCTVEPGDKSDPGAPGASAVRTYKLLRKSPDGLAYALSIAQRRGLTRELILGRIRR